MTSPEDVANEIVENLVDWDQECWGNNRTTQDTIEVIATALRVYGDERAREAVKDLKLSCPLCGETLAARTGG